MKNIYKSVGLCSLLIAFVLFESACSGGAKSVSNKNHILIGFCIDTLKEDRWQRDKAIFEAKVMELGAEVKTLAANTDDASQLSQAEQLISEGANVLVVVPHNANASSIIVQKAHKEGIKVISYDRLIRDADVDYYISFDNIRAGEMQAQAIVEKAPKGNYVYIGGAETDNNAHMFREGAMKVLKPLEEKGNIRVVYDSYTHDWRPEIALNNMENALSANHNNVQAVIAANDGTAGGVISALAEQGLLGKVPVSGQDADLAALQRIVEGTQTMTVYKPIDEIAAKAAEMAVSLAKGQAVATDKKVNNGKFDVRSILLDPIEVTKENISETVIKDGFQKTEEIYKNVPKEKWPGSQ